MALPPSASTPSPGSTRTRCWSPSTRPAPYSGSQAPHDSDLVRFDATSLGPATDGTFSLYFDGSDVGLTTSGEDVDALELLPNGDLLLSTLNTASGTGGGGEDEDLLRFLAMYLSTYNNFAVAGVSGADEDVFVFTPTSTGDTTSGTFSSTLYFDGSVHGLAANDVIDIDLP